MPDLIEQLRDAGIDARGYKRGPAGARPFVASIDPHPRAGRLYVWEGRSKIDVATNKRQRQGVLNISEEGRELVATITPYPYVRNQQGEPIGFRSEEDIVKRAVSDMRSRWSLPHGTHYEGTLTFMPKIVRRFYTTARVTVRAIAPASNTSLLVGMDETHHFVAQLPKFGVGSVAEAHRILAPAEARAEGTKRQGEWFFVPVRTVTLIEWLMNYLTQVTYQPLESHSSHLAAVLRRNGKTYAIGTVLDNRPGRHAPLLLTEFHEVIRNLEVAVPTTTQRPERRYWD